MMKFADNNKHILKQYDGEQNALGDKNVIAAFESDNNIIFNETYYIVGDVTRAIKIQAMYDLTIIGDIVVEECVVHGSLTVIGDVCINNLTCGKSFYCQGSVRCSKIYVSGNINAASIDCDVIECDSNVVINTTISINQLADIKHNVVACEGIIGEGKFCVENAIANNYFDFEGDKEGRILELESDTIISEKESFNGHNTKSLDNMISELNSRIMGQLAEIPNLEENKIVDLLKDWQGIDLNILKVLSDAKDMFSSLIDISYNNRINNLNEYIIVLYAKRMLPKELFMYESIEHINSLMLPRATNEIDRLEFKISSVEQFSELMVMALAIVDLLQDKFDIVMDKLFGAIGLKYLTVSSIINKYIQGEIVVQAQGESIQKNIETEIQVIEVPKTDRSQSVESKREFLNKKLAHVWKRIGLSDAEFERLTSMKIRTISEFVEASDRLLTKAFGKKVFLVPHLLQTRDKLLNKINEMKDE